MIYTALYLALCSLVPFGSARGRGNVALLAAATVILFLFVGFRWEVGCDWSGYWNIFELHRQSTVEEAVGSREAGFSLLNVLIHALALDYFFVNVASALLFFLGLFLFAQREHNPLAVVALSFPVLIVNMPMSGMRQAIAIGCLMVAINAYRDGKRVLYAALVLIAATFHQTAILFLGLAPLIRIEKTIATVGFALLLSAPALYLISTDLIGFYSERYGEAAIDSTGAPFRTGVLALVGAAFLLTMQGRWRRAFPDDHELYLIASLLMIASFPVALYSSTVGDRLGYYLIPFQVVVLTRIPILFKKDPLVPVYAAAPYVGFLVFFALWTNFSALFEQCYLPYRSVLTGQD